MVFLSFVLSAKNTKKEIIIEINGCRPEVLVRDGTILMYVECVFWLNLIFWYWQACCKDWRV